MLSNSFLKHTKQGQPLQVKLYHKFSKSHKFCVVEIRKKLDSPEIKQFLVSYGKPHTAASDDTISRWIKNIISSAGIDIEIFTVHQIYIYIYIYIFIYIIYMYNNIYHVNIYYI